MSVVIDSSITLAWFFDDERSLAADTVLHDVAESGAVVPSLWRMEVANAFHMAVRRQRINTTFRDASLADLRALAVEIDPETDQQAWATTLHLAERFSLTLDDAAYLELAQRRNLPLATLDQALRTASGVLGVTLRGS
ncbi:MAG: type II toxin-antitoxin system VapC family toxin [Gammaproteobacteria bacterium]|nr:type II toxin-antitoxin system VapC family toxin [Gammaproteobacteria bacterium]